MAPKRETKDFPGIATGVDGLSPERDAQLYARHAEVKTLEDLTKEQRGTPIPALFNQFYKFIQNPSTVSVETYKRMVDTDDTIGSGVDFLTICLAARLGRYQHPSNEITEWVNKALDIMDGGWFNTQKELLSAAWAGYSVGEKVWANTDMGFIIKRIVTLPPSTILFETNREGEITPDGILQYQRNYNPLLLSRGINFFGGSSGTSYGFADTCANRPDAYAKFGDLPFPLRTANTYNYLSIRIPKLKCIHYAYDAQGKFGNPYGRALTLDTPILTMNGWSTMGEVKIGDVIFDERGRFTNIIGKSEVWNNRAVYRVHFSDKTYIDADENHLWKCTSAHDRNWKKVPSVRSTKELFDHWNTPSKKYRRFAIDLPEPLNLPRREYLIDPYILGQWLGDGNKQSGNITTHVDDAEDLRELIEGRGYSCSSPEVNGRSSKGRKIYIEGLQTQLRALGLLLNKRIPIDYLMGSHDQRMELLRGLMDSDGTISKCEYIDKDGYPIYGGYCSFSNTNKDLIDGVAFLVRSLGMIATVRQKPRYWGDKRLLDSWDVIFTPRDQIVFNFKRKRERLRARDNNQVNKKYIRKIERIESQPTVCIEVDSPSHLFLAGKALTPTHNSILRRAYKWWVMKDAFLKMLAIALDRKGTPLTIVFADPNSSLIDPSKYNKTTGARDQDIGIRADVAAQEAFNEVHNDTVIILPGKKGQIYDTEFVPQDSNSDAFIGAINLCNKSLMRAMLVPALIFGDGDGTGSFALATTHAKTFDKILDGSLSGFKQTMLDQGIRELVAYNFPQSAWKKDGFGDFSKREMSVEEREAEMEMYDRAIHTGIADTNKLEDLNKMRETAGFEAVDEPFESRLPDEGFNETMPLPIRREGE